MGGVGGGCSPENGGAGGGVWKAARTGGSRWKLLQGIAIGPPYEYSKRRHAMGEKGSKKDKNKANKQKQEKNEKKKEQQISKLPAKKP
jgi:hypothetical protein